MAAEQQAATALQELGTSQRDIIVTLSNELVHLLSEQMYRSPLKAIEELVVNSYDAEACVCRLRVPLPPHNETQVVVFDDGFGMAEDGLQNLWHIGRSNKRELEVARRVNRKQIGKFGIGKIATYSIASLVTYISKTDEIRGVTVDFRDFAEDPTGGQPIKLQVRQLTGSEFAGDERLTGPLVNVGVSLDEAMSLTSWTLAILEDLKPKMGRIRRRDLNWVLSTAMPLGGEFALYLNGADVESRKANYTPLVQFDVTDLPKARLDKLEEETGGQWRVQGDALVGDNFPSGISGEVLVTEQSLYTGKSADLARSHGFFVKVRGRLVDEQDPLFGIEPLSYEVFNRFRADLVADDLDAVVTAPREGFEESEVVSDFKSVLTTVFYEARGRYEASMRDRAEARKRKPEDQRQFVNPDFVERPLADALATRGTSESGDDADGDWFYVRVPRDTNAVERLVDELYKPERRRFKYVDVDGGRSGRVVEFDPTEATFYINIDHPVVQAHADPKAIPLLEDLLTAEVLLEVYLREHGVVASMIGAILERRDLLLRSLASDHIFSVTAIGADLRSSKDDQYDLEVQLVLAARALGFVAKHIGGADRADGLARFTEYPGGERRIILEAKSSEEVPSLSSIDFGGLHQHMLDEDAEGCLLVAPDYPGGSRGENAQAARRAQSLGISCWTVDQLASVVEASEARHITAADVRAIVVDSFRPEDVAEAVTGLLSDPKWVAQELYAAVVDALRDLHGRMTDRPRTVDQIASEVTRLQAFHDTDHRSVRAAVNALAGASQGLLHVVGGDKLVLRGDYDELERRVASLTGRTPPARRTSTFRDSS